MSSSSLQRSLDFDTKIYLLKDTTLGGLVFTAASPFPWQTSFTLLYCHLQVMSISMILQLLPPQCFHALKPLIFIWGILHMLVDPPCLEMLFKCILVRCRKHMENDTATPPPTFPYIFCFNFLDASASLGLGVLMRSHCWKNY